MHNINKLWFTLIELMIVITIIVILTVVVMVPYNLYSNIAKVRMSQETISQTIDEARNSVSWLINAWQKKNVNIWLEFKKWSETINMISFPFDYSWAINWNLDSPKELVRKIHLESWVQLSEIKNSAWDELDYVIMYFKAPEWGFEFYVNDTHTWSIKEILVWLKWTKSWLLSKNITF